MSKPSDRDMRVIVTSIERLMRVSTSQGEDASFLARLRRDCAKVGATTIGDLGLMAADGSQERQDALFAQVSASLDRERYWRRKGIETDKELDRVKGELTVLRRQMRKREDKAASTTVQPAMKMADASRLMRERSQAAVQRRVSAHGTLVNAAIAEITGGRQLTLDEIAAALNAKGVPAARGGLWTRKQVHRVFAQKAS